jgi:hypothetical protein
MSEKISLKMAERKVFRTAFRDGLWDILIGCFVLQFAIAPLLSRRLGDFWSSAVFIPLWVLVFVAIRLGKKHIVRPRIGLVKFGPARVKILTRLTTVMVAVNLAAFILGVYVAFNFKVFPGWMYPLFMGLMVLALSSVAAYALNTPRYFVYGLLFLFSFAIGEWLFIQFRVPHHGFPVTFGITAAIIILTGLSQFFRFLRDNPLPSDRTPLEESAG